MLQPVFSIKEICSNFLDVEKEQSWHQMWLMRASPLPLPPSASLKSDHILSHFLTRQKCHHGRDDLAPFFIFQLVPREWRELCSLFCVYRHRYSPIHSCLPVDKTDKWKPIMELIETTTVCSLSSSLQDDTRTCDKEFRQCSSLPCPWLLSSEGTAAQLFEWTAAFLPLAMVHGTMVYEYNWVHLPEFWWRRWFLCK